MSSTINASTASGGGVVTTADASGILQLQTAGTTALTIDASQNVSFTKAINKLALPTGSVLQVVNVTGNTLQSTVSTTPVATSITASITPNFTTSKILVLWNGRIYNNLNGNAGLFVYRSGSSIQGGYTVVNNAGVIGANQLATVLDSPATTSATTYTIYIAASAGTTSINLNGATDGRWQFTLMEIA